MVKRERKSITLLDGDKEILSSETNDTDGEIKSKMRKEATSRNLKDPKVRIVNHTLNLKITVRLWN